MKRLKKTDKDPTNEGLLIAGATCLVHRAYKMPIAPNSSSCGGIKNSTLGASYFYSEHLTTTNSWRYCYTLASDSLNWGVLFNAILRDMSSFFKYNRQEGSEGLNVIFREE